ncbi:MAG TPA: MoaD/ThiS family protein [Dissulfurispiraceae bacterium]|nr:MoaD/ThiS family protein [Dissulfurispiraceae bacterium]
MHIIVKLFATLRNGRFEQDVLHLADGVSVQHVVDMLSIRSDEAAIIFVNGRHADPEAPLSDGDTLSIFPPIGGG